MERLERGATRRRAGDLMTRFSEAALHQVHVIGIVLDEENPDAPARGRFHVHSVGNPARALKGRSVKE